MDIAFNKSLSNWIKLMMVSDYIHPFNQALISTGFLPVTSSNNTTPNENISDLTVSFPLDAYSGAIYLKYPNQCQANLHLIR